MLTQRFALGLTLLLLLAACTESRQQQTTAPAEDTISGGAAAGEADVDASPTSEDPPDTTTAAEGSAAVDDDTSQPGTSADAAPAGGIDTTGAGPASIPQGRYTTTSSGLKYYDLQEGSGASPEPTDRVRVHYTGWLQQNGRKFDSSYDRGQPATFPLNGVIKGWTEGLQSMQVGGKRQLVIPPDLAYGQKGAGPIPPGATLVFEVKLLGIEGQ